MDGEITSGTMQKLLGVNRVALNDLAKRGIVTRGKKRGSYAIESVAGTGDAGRSQGEAIGGLPEFRSLQK
jgi:hypothetical protein